MFLKKVKKYQMSIAGLVPITEWYRSIVIHISLIDDGQLLTLVLPLQGTFTFLTSLTIGRVTMTPPPSRIRYKAPHTYELGTRG